MGMSGNDVQKPANPELRLLPDFNDPKYYEVKNNGISSFQNMLAYLGGSAIQTVGDNPVTAYRQLVQQYAKSLDGKVVDPSVARHDAKAVFRATPLTASLSGLMPRLIGVLFKRVPKFGVLLGYTALSGDTDRATRLQPPLPSYRRRLSTRFA